MAVYTRTEGCRPTGQAELLLTAEVLSVLTWWGRGFPLLSWGKQRGGAWTPGREVRPRALLSVGGKLLLQSDGSLQAIGWGEKASRTPQAMGQETSGESVDNLQLN